MTIKAKLIWSCNVYFAVLFAPHSAGLAQPALKTVYGDLSIVQAVEQQASMAKSRYRLLAQEEAQLAGLPADLVDAVIKVESDYEASRIGSVGEIGLMQVRPATAAMLGFKGTAKDLADPAVNIHFGATYLGRAWHLTNGDICRTLMKYRAGHGEEVMSPLSTQYCSRARAHLASVGSPLASMIAAPVLVAATKSESEHPRPPSVRIATAPKHGAAFWAAEEARVRTITARIHARWSRIASRT